MRLVGLGGLQFTRLLRQLRAVCEPGYDLVLLDFGTNDLAAGCSAELLADRVVAVAETMLAIYGVKRVVVLEVFPSAVGLYRCLPEFNSEARRSNILIRERLAFSNQIHCHHHKGMVTNWQQYLVDGVHLDGLGCQNTARQCAGPLLATPTDGKNRADCYLLCAAVKCCQRLEHPTF